MGCGTCGNKGVINVVRPGVPKLEVVSLGKRQMVSVPIEDCEYTSDQLNAWLKKLVCCKNKALYLKLGIIAQTMNKYLGDTKSALNYPTNICFFKKQLDLISDFIILISATEQC